MQEISFIENHRVIKKKIKAYQDNLIRDLRWIVHSVLIRMKGQEIQIYGPQLFGDTGYLRGKVITVSNSTVTIKCDSGLLQGKHTIPLEDIQKIWV